MISAVRSFLFCMLVRFVYKKIFELMLGESYDAVNNIIDYSVKVLKEDREKFFRAPILTGFVGILSGEYKGLIDDAIGFAEDEHGNSYLSEDLLKLSLDVVDYLKDRLEGELLAIS